MLLCCVTQLHRWRRRPASQTSCASVSLCFVLHFVWGHTAAWQLRCALQMHSVPPTSRNQTQRPQITAPSHLADCPNPRCSETIVLDAEPAPDSPLVCPACDTKLCAWCNTVWHKGFSCKEYQVGEEVSQSARHTPVQAGRQARVGLRADAFAFERAGKRLRSLQLPAALHALLIRACATNCHPLLAHLPTPLLASPAQELPASERQPEDVALFDVAKRSRWQRCSQCRQMIELGQGCRHMTCKCGHEFCYTCGKAWWADKTAGTRTCEQGSHGLCCGLWNRNLLCTVHLLPTG